MSTLDDSLGLVARQESYVANQPTERLLLALDRCLRHWTSDPRTRALILEMEHEALEFVRGFSDFEKSCASAVRELVDDFCLAAPDLDDSKSERGDGPPEDAWYWSLAHVRGRLDDLSAGKTTPPHLVPSGPNRSTVEIMLDIMRKRISQAETALGRGGPFVALEARRADLAGEHSAELSRLIWQAKTVAGFSLMRLRYLVSAASPAEDPRDMGPNSPIRRLVDQRIQTSGILALGHLAEDPFMLLFAEASPPKPDDVERVAKVAREELALVIDELRFRLGTTRSRRATVDRFRHRCEWYDRTRLAELADAATGRPEAALTQELARYLFDQGLNPIAKPSTGPVEPDLLDPSQIGGFYVEAKQYKRSCPTTLRRGIWQAHSTLAILKGTEYEVNEGFYVVFRRSGPRYQFPDALPGNGWILYPVLVDLSPEVGSRVLSPPTSLRLDDVWPHQT